MPFLSVVTVTRNDIAGFLDTRCSVGQQTCRDIEWIVIDGGSTDGTKELLAGSPDVNYWVSEPDKGIYDAMNKGLERSSGMYVMFMNSGDQFAETNTVQKIKDAVDAASGRRTPDFLYGDAIDVTGPQDVGRVKRALDVGFLWWGMFARHQAMLFLREVASRERYDTRWVIAADYAFVARVLRRCVYTVRVPFPICRFLLGGVSSTRWKRGVIEAHMVRRREIGVATSLSYVVLIMQTVSACIQMLVPWLYQRMRYRGKEGSHSIDPGSVPVSVLIPARNEAVNIGVCLSALSWSRDVVVLDSMSSDGTDHIAARHGSRVVKREFDDFSKNKNWALRNIHFEYPWLLIVDADEIVTPRLAVEISIAVQSSEYIGYFIPRRNWFAGRPIRHAGRYPDWQLRLFRVGEAEYEERSVHEHMIAHGPVGFLKAALEHNDRKPFARWIEKQNHFSSLEAIEAGAVRRNRPGRQTMRGSLWRRGPARARALKEWAYRHLPYRPLLRFLWMYIIRGGFLDGAAGFRYCFLLAGYELWVTLKMEEAEKPYTDESTLEPFSEALRDG